MVIKDEATQALLHSLNPEVQKAAQERLTNAMKAYGEEMVKKNLELAELRKIKVDAAVVKYLVQEFNLSQADVELMLRKNDNNLDTVLDLIIAAQP